MPKNSKLGPIKFPIDTHRQLGSKISFQAIEVKPPEVDIKLEKSETHKDIGVGASADVPRPEGDLGDRVIETASQVINKTSQFFKGTGEASAKAGQKINLLRGEKIDLYFQRSWATLSNSKNDFSKIGFIF